MGRESTCSEFPVEVPGPSILDWKAPVGMSEKFPYYLTGYSKDGAPVWIIEFGKWDLKGVTKVGGDIEENFDKYTQQCFRKWVESSKEIPANPGFHIIADMDGYSLAQAGCVAAVQKYLWIVRLFVDTIKEGNFKWAKVINANNLFLTTWNISKPLFGSVLNDISFHGINNTEWKEELLQEISKEELSVKYGGTKQG